MKKSEKSDILNEVDTHPDDHRWFISDCVELFIKDWDDEDIKQFWFRVHSIIVDGKKFTCAKCKQKFISQKYRSGNPANYYNVKGKKYCLDCYEE